MGSTAIIAGILCGQIYEYRYLVNTGRLNASQWGWYRSSPLKIAMRVLVTVLVLAPIYGFRILSSMLLANTVDENVYGRVLISFVIGSAVPSFLVGLLMFGHLRMLFHKVGLDAEEAHGKAFEPRRAFIESIGLEYVGNDKQEGQPEGNTLQSTHELA